MQVEVVISSPRQHKRVRQGTNTQSIDEKATDVLHLDDHPTSSSSMHPIDLPSAQSASKRARRTSTPPWSHSNQEESRTPTRPSSPSGPETSSPSSKSPTTHTLRTPVKSATSLPVLSPLTPLSATPLKRTSTHPMDHTTTPTTSKRKVDTLSELFDISPKGTRRHDFRPLPSKVSKPIAKRMLGRTRTAPSVVDDPSADTSLDTLTSKSSSVSFGLPPSPQPDYGYTIDPTTSGSAVSQTSSVHDEQSQSSVPGPSSGAPQRSGVRTYAGRSRSFLVELPTDSNPDSGVDADDLGLEIRESYKDLRMRWGVDNSEDDPRLAVSARSSPEPENGRKGKGKAKDRPKVALPPNMMNDLKSITELRSKGESRRFMDEVGYLFEGMEQGAGVRVRRGSALELVTKYCDTGFARRAKATDFCSRTWDALRAAGAGDGDKVLDAILVLFAALADFVPVLWDILATLSGTDSLDLVGSGADDGELKKAGIGKAEKLTLTALRSVIINKSGLVSDEVYPSLRQLLSQALASLPPSVHQNNHLTALHQILLPGYASGLPLLPDASDFVRSPGVPQLDYIADCLELFDSFLLGRWASGEEQPPLYHNVINGDGQDDLAERLATLCAVCCIILRNGDYEDYIPIANRCLESALRVLVNVSHENPTWCELLLHQELMIPVMSSLIASSLCGACDMTEEIGERDAQAFDRLCLALGLLTNLVQVDKTSKDLCRETKLDPSCPAHRQCAYACSCPNAVSFLECLVSVYEQHHRLEDDDPGTHIIRGHLAVLFGLLMRDSSANQDIILDVLPGAGLKGLIRHAKEFVELYAEFMARVARGEKHDAGDAEDDLEEIAPARDSATQDVAQDIIRFLEGLMDT
ncbi:hypothetical protein BJV78DRAFT_1207765 [Lactifluus subvellereus]|nr:hypothetical protein BJV78DRAFT_1207765 [Lactifluus subvellereus]